MKNNIFQNPTIDDLKNIKDWAFIMTLSFVKSKTFKKLNNDKRSNVIYFLEEFRYFTDKASVEHKDFSIVRGRKIPKALVGTILSFEEKKKMIKLIDLLDKCFLEAEDDTSVFDVLEVVKRTRRYKADLLRWY